MGLPFRIEQETEGEFQQVILDYPPYNIHVYTIYKMVETELDLGKIEPNEILERIKELKEDKPYFREF